MNSHTTPYLTVDDDALFVALIIGVNERRNISPNYPLCNETEPYNREQIIKHGYETLLQPSYGPFQSVTTVSEINYMNTYPNISTIVTCSVEEWNNREHQKGRQSKGELFPDVIIDGQEEIGTFLKNYEFEYASVGTMTYFPRNWPGILSLNCENPVELHYEKLESCERQFDEDVAISTREHTRQVWTNSEDMNEEIRLRASNPEYLVKKIDSREEKERQLNEYNLELKKYNQALKSREDIYDDPAVARRGIDSALVTPPLPPVPIPPPPGRTLTFPPWRVPVQVLIARKTNPPLAPRGRARGFK